MAGSPRESKLKTRADSLKLERLIFYSPKEWSDGEMDDGGLPFPQLQDQS